MRKVVELKFGALPNKELRTLRQWPTIHEKVFPLHFLGTRLKEHI